MPFDFKQKLNPLTKFTLRITKPFRQHKILTFVGLLILLGVGYWLYQGQATSQEELTLQHPVRKNLKKTLSISGVVDAKEKARLRFLAGGKVVYVGAKEGEKVEKWQTIATIDQRAAQKQLEQSLNTYQKERLDWDQTNVDVYEDTYTTDEERIREKAQLDLYNQVLSVEINTVNIDSSRLTAPFGGILTVSPTNVSGVQLAGSDYFEIVNPESLIFRAAVDEVDLAGLTVGLPASFELDAYDEETFETRLQYISYTASETQTSTVFIVELPIDTIRYGQDRFRIGMNGEASVVIDTRSDVLTIPLEATREREGRTYVDVQVGETPDSVEEREIEIGLETNDDVEVISGLTTDDLVVIP